MFQALQISNNIEAEIESQTKKLVDAGNVEAIFLKPVPANVQVPSFDLSVFFAILKNSLEDIHVDAERLVKDHIMKMDVPVLEAWISEGQQFKKTEKCPYCGQNTSGLQLITAYRSHFNVAYETLKNKVAILASGIEKRASDEVAIEIAKVIAGINQCILGWAEHKKIDPVEFEIEDAKNILKQIRELLKPLAKKKVLSPSEAIINQDIQERASVLWQKFTKIIIDVNEYVTKIRTEIEEFKKSLVSVNVQNEKAALHILQLRKIRHSEEVVKLLELRKLASDQVTQLEDRKNIARKELNALMDDTLKNYQKEINAILLKFGASFTIESMDANYRGGSPRSEYILKLRGKTVQIDKNNAAFTNSLSEGDKRTLAFAFFVASAFQDVELAQKIVVIDDPMCSFDLNRKSQTQNVLRRLFSESMQLIVLAHDLHFLKELRANLIKINSNAVSALQVKCVSNGYSDFDSMDFDEACEGSYYKNHRQLMLFAGGDVSADAYKTAKAIRPFLEGYLHRRFPGHLPANSMFGQVINFIRDAGAHHPVAAAKILIDCLTEINEYVGKFHHDTNDGHAEHVVVVESELRPYTVRALNIAYSGAAS